MWIGRKSRPDRRSNGLNSQICCRPDRVQETHARDDNIEVVLALKIGDHPAVVERKPGTGRHDLGILRQRMLIQNKNKDNIVGRFRKLRRINLTVSHRVTKAISESSDLNLRADQATSWRCNCFLYYIGTFPLVLERASHDANH